MDIELFRNQLLDYIENNKNYLVSNDGKWIIKGFIDIYKDVYTFPLDTKVLSKLIEILIFQIFQKFSKEYNYTLKVPKYQNHYPDITLLCDDKKIAIDIKTTYRKSKTSVNGFTLGSFTGYFRDRESTKNILYPYGEYDYHFVLGIIYDRINTSNQYGKYPIKEIDNIESIIGNFLFILQEKWKIASDKPGSGNTKNIGSITNINDLIGGNGPFSKFDLETFDNYWKNYLTIDMAQSINSPIQYKNLEEYIQWKSKL